MNRKVLGRKEEFDDYGLVQDDVVESLKKYFTLEKDVIVKYMNDTQIIDVSDAQ